MENPTDQVSNNFGQFEILKERSRQRTDELIKEEEISTNFFLHLRNFCYSGVAVLGFAAKMSDVAFGGTANALGPLARDVVRAAPLFAQQAFYSVATWFNWRIAELGRLHRGRVNPNNPFMIQDVIRGQNDVKLLMTILSFLGGVGLVLHKNSQAFRELLDSSIRDKDKLVEISRRAYQDLEREMRKVKTPPTKLYRKNLLIQGITSSAAQQALLDKSDKTYGKMQKSVPAIISPSSNAGRLLSYLFEEDEDQFPLDRRVQINDGSAFVTF